MVLLYQSALSGLLMGLKGEVSGFCWVYVFLFFRMTVLSEISMVCHIN